MITMNPRPGTLDAELVASYQSISPATLGHALDTAMDPGIRALWRPVHIAGTALTVRTDRDLFAAVHEVIKIAQPGDILVVSSAPDNQHAVTGEFTLRTAQEYGIAGLVIDGLMADGRALEGMSFPVFCRGASPGLLSAVPRPSAEQEAQINVTVQIGGVTVNPGDLILADDDGVLVATPEDAKLYIHSCQKMEDGEAYARSQLATGKTLTAIRQEMHAAGTPLSVFQHPR